MYSKYTVNIDADVYNKGGLTLDQIIMAGLDALNEPYNSDTFYIYSAGGDD